MIPAAVEDWHCTSVKEPGRHAGAPDWGAGRTSEWTTLVSIVEKGLILPTIPSLEAIGMNPIFGHREDERVQHDPIIANRLGKRTKKPDAVFGLRRTRNIENLLHDTRKSRAGQIDGQQLHEELQPSPLAQPLDQNGDELLYPFLLLEAKSGKSDCDWHSIQMQSAFPIRTFLETQHRLQMASDAQQSQPTPLVWFFANRGEDWHVSVAFMAEGRERPNTVGDMDYVSQIQHPSARRLISDTLLDHRRRLARLYINFGRRSSAPNTGRLCV